MAFFRLRNALSNPKQILKLIAVTICLCVACYQLSECFRKLLRPPVSTHHSFDLNETLNYPAVTVCRTSPYKSSVYEKYGIDRDGPTKSRSWAGFNFENYTIQEFFEEATYSQQEVIPFFGFDNLDTNVDVTSSYSLHYGRCFTLTPKNETTKWDSDGYFLYLTHTEDVKLLNDKGISLSGFHVVIRDRSEVFTGYGNKVDSFADYLYGETYEEIKLNLKVNVYQQLATKDSHCNNSYSYSLSKCQLSCMQKLITEKVGCSAPWLPNSDFQHCQDYNTTRLLMTAYDSYNRDNYIKQCACPQACNIKVYSHYIHNIKETDTSSCNIAISFSSNLVTTMSEVIGYDWNLFLSDLGGSLGFLLGISVLGLVNMFEEVVNILLCKQKDNGDMAEKVENADKAKDEIYLTQKKLLEEVVAKNNTGVEYFDNSKPNNNHTKYIQNKY